MLSKKDLREQTEAIKEHVKLMVEPVADKLSELSEKNDKDHAAIFTASNRHAGNIRELQTDMKWYKRIGGVISALFVVALGKLTFWEK